MNICKKSPWWLAPALLLALGCGPDVQVAKFEVEDDKPKAESTATESNTEFVGKGKSGADEQMTDTSGRDGDVAGDEERAPSQEQEEQKKPSKKKPAAKEEEDEPAAKEKTISDMELPKDGKAEDYEKFLNELIAMPPTSRVEQKKMVALVSESVKKILELEKDQASARWKQAFGFSLQLKVGEMVPLLEGVYLAKGEDKVKEATDALQKAVDAYLEPLNERKPDDVLAQGIAPLSQMLGQLPIPAVSTINIAVVEKFAPKFEASEEESMKELAKMLLASIRLPKLVGNEVKLTGKTVDEKEFDVTEWKGKVVLIDFWATWCPPCVAEYPNMLKNYKAYHEKGFEIIGISADRALNDLTEYIEKKKVPWPNIYVEGGHPAVEEYGVQGYPTMVLIGRDGKVLSVNARGEELDRLLEEQFADSKPAAEEGNKEETPEKKEPEKKDAPEEKKEEPKS